MAIKTWDGGGGDGNIGTAANWDSDTLPSAGDDASIRNETRTLVGTLNVALESLTIAHEGDIDDITVRCDNSADAFLELRNTGQLNKINVVGSQAVNVLRVKTRTARTILVSGSFGEVRCGFAPSFEIEAAAVVTGNIRCAAEHFHCKVNATDIGDVWFDGGKAFLRRDLDDLYIAPGSECQLLDAMQLTGNADVRGLLDIRCSGDIAGALEVHPRAIATDLKSRFGITIGSSVFWELADTTGLINATVTTPGDRSVIRYRARRLAVAEHRKRRCNTCRRQRGPSRFWPSSPSQRSQHARAFSSAPTTRSMR